MWIKGVGHSEETKRKISIANKGKILTEEHKRKIGEANRNPSEETRLKLREARKKQIPPMLGKHHKEETKQKISKANKGQISWNTGYNHCILSQEAIEWINGELLGDGCLQSCSPCSARFQYGSKHKEYINYISDVLESFGIKRSGKIHKKHHTDRGMDCYGYQYKTLSYVELLPLREKWYLDGKKVVPRDIKITPVTLRQWHIGDGYLRKRKYGRPHIILATSGFLINDVDWLVEQIGNLGIKAKRTPRLNIYISARSVKRFINYIGECPVSCYQYKFSYEKGG
ncbi:hypothetical protein ES708_31393 [subsurface metagenome]